MELTRAREEQYFLVKVMHGEAGTSRHHFSGVARSSKSSGVQDTMDSASCSYYTSMESACSTCYKTAEAMGIGNELDHVRATLWQ